MEKITKEEYLRKWFEHIDQIEKIPTFDSTLHAQLTESIKKLKKVIIRASRQMYYFEDGEGYSQLLEKFKDDPTRPDLSAFTSDDYLSEVPFDQRSDLWGSVLKHFQMTSCINADSVQSYKMTSEGFNKIYLMCHRLLQKGICLTALTTPNPRRNRNGK
ncbi:MAG: hypothetical protein ACTSPB_01165 [Candidatus Thorarchaeota archaeon]